MLINVTYHGRTIPILVENIPDMTPEEAARYVEYVQERITTPLTLLKITHCADGKVDLHYEGDGEPFERIRRITGYLTGALTSWNDSKQAEERERVKHFGGD